MKLLLVTSLLMLPLFFANAGGKGGPCKADREKFCANAEKGGGAMHQCMKDNMEKMSPECKAHFEKMKTSMKGMMEACQEDMHKLCMDENGEMAKMPMRKCMMENKDKLSEACKTAMAEMPKMNGMGKKMRGGKHMMGHQMGAPMDAKSAAPEAPATTEAAPAAPATEKK